HARRTVDDLLEAGDLGWTSRPPKLEDGRERAVGTVAEVLLERGTDVLRVGTRHVERIREERRELRAREAAGEEDHDPENQDQEAVPQHESRPGDHASTLPGRVPFPGLNGP